MDLTTGQRRLVFVVVVIALAGLGIYLLQGHRIDWGLALVVLAILGFAMLLSPPSLRALTHSQRDDQH